VSVEPAIFGGAEQRAETVCSVEGGPGTFAFADAIGDGGDGDERALPRNLGDRTNRKTPTVANLLTSTTKKDWTSLSPDMTIPNGTANDGIDDAIDFSDLEAT
jgi:hypothetical protein